LCLLVSGAKSLATPLTTLLFSPVLSGLSFKLIQNNNSLRSQITDKSRYCFKAVTQNVPGIQYVQTPSTQHKGEQKYSHLPGARIKVGWSVRPHTHTHTHIQTDSLATLQTKPPHITNVSRYSDYAKGCVTRKRESDFLQRKKIFIFHPWRQNGPGPHQAT
jgi:hypothetical protein